MKRKILLRTALLATTLMLLSSVGWGQTQTYTLITTDSELELDAKYLIVGYNGANAFAMGLQNANNRAAVSVTVSSNSIVVEPASGATDTKPFEVTLKGSAGAWNLFDAVNSTYLRPRTGANNGLQGQATITDANWTISIAESGISTMVCENTTTYPRNILRYNSVNALFACYASGQNDVYLFKLEPPTTDPTLNANPVLLSGLSYYLNNGPSSSKSFILTGSNLNGTDVTVTAPANFEVSLDDASFSSSVPLTAFDGSETDIFVRLAADLEVGNYSGNLTAVGGGDTEGVTVALSGKVVEAFGIPYSNPFATSEDRDIATLQGFDLVGTFAESTYTRLVADAYIETPVIDFTQYDYLRVGFSTATFGGFANQALELQISVDGGEFVGIYTAFPKTTSYINNDFIIDLTGAYNSANGKLRFKMVTATNSTRIKDLSLVEAVIWNGTGNWDVTANWSNSSLPSANVWPVINIGTVTVNDDVTVKGINVNGGANLTISETFTLTADKVTLKTGTDRKAGSLINNGTLTAPVFEYQRYVPAASFEYFSSPVSGQTANVFAPLGTGSPNNGLFVFDVTADNWATAITATGTSIVAMQGYAFIANINQTIYLSGNSYYSGNQTIQLSKAANGFNLVGNPYPSAIDWDLETAWTRDDVSPNIWINFANLPTEASFATYNWDTNVQTNWTANIGTDVGIIAPTQAFWVENISETPPPSLVDLTVMPTAQVHSANVVNKKSTSENPLVRLQAQRSGYSDEMVIFFHSEATEGMDRFDTRKKLGSGAYPQIYAPVADAIAAVNTLPQSLLSDKVVVPITLKSDMAGSITIALTELKNLGDDMNIILTDKATGTQTDLRTGAYTVEVEAGSTLTNRLEVTIERKNVTSAPAIDKSTVNIYASAKNIYVGMAQQGSSVEVYNAIGVQMLSQKLNGGAVESIQTNLPKGVYIVVVNGKEGRTVKRVFIQ